MPWFTTTQLIFFSVQFPSRGHNKSESSISIQLLALPEGKNFSRELIVVNFFPTIRGNWFSRIGLNQGFRGNWFMELGLTKDFVGINLRECILYKHFAGMWWWWWWYGGWAPSKRELKARLLDIDPFLFIVDPCVEWASLAYISSNYVQT